MCQMHLRPAVLHLWVEHDHDSNSNGLPESSEDVQARLQEVTRVIPTQHFMGRIMTLQILVSKAKLVSTLNHMT